MEERYPDLAWMDLNYLSGRYVKELESEALSHGIDLKDLTEYYLLKNHLAWHDTQRTHEILGHLEDDLSIQFENPLSK